MSSTASARRNHINPHCKLRNIRKPGMCYRRFRTGVRKNVPRYAIKVSRSNFNMHYRVNTRRKRINRFYG